MDLNLLSRILQELILDYNRISLPGLGSFIIESLPAYFSEDGNTIFPPTKRVSFQQKESWDDMLLARRYRKEKGVTMDVARKDVKAFLAKFEEDLKQSKNIEIPGFGKMRSTKEGNYFFVADKRLGIFAEDMGLEPISLKILNENPDQVLDISEEMSSIVGNEISLEENPIKEEDMIIDTTDYPVVTIDEEDPVIMERRKRIIIILSIINVLLVLTVLFLIFMEPILGLFEGMMYSEEEMELLRQNGLV